MAATFDTIDPTTGRTIATVPDMDEAQVRQAVQRARGAFRVWSRLDFGERRVLERQDRRGGGAHALVPSSGFTPSSLVHVANH